MKRLLQLLIILLPLHSFAQKGFIFTENKGQWDNNILFRTEIPNGILYVEKDGLTYMFSEPMEHRHGAHDFHDSPEHPDKRSKEETIQRHAVKVSFYNGISKNSMGYYPIEGYSNYFIGNDKKKWASKVQSYESIILKSIYPNIDFKLYKKENAIKYEFILHPGANAKDILLRIDGADDIQINENMGLEIITSLQLIHENKPYCYEIEHSKKKEVECSFKKIKNNYISFSLGKYSTSNTLIIDPELVFSSYTGSTTDNWGFTASYDRYGNAFSGGIVRGNGYPTSLGAYSEFFNGGNWDIGILKLSEDGTKRIFATYLGGSEDEMPQSIIANSNDELILFGTTGSPDFPTVNAIQQNFKGGTQVIYDGAISFPYGTDIYVAKLSKDGSQLLGSTFIGGSNNDGLNFIHDSIPLYSDKLCYNYGDGARGEVSVDKNDNIYIGSCTFSSDFPTQNASQNINNGGLEGIFLKLSGNLSNLIISSYYGGSQNDAIYSIDVSESGTIYFAGGTQSTDLKTTANAYNTEYQGGSTDAFLAKTNINGTAIERATYFGSNRYDQAHFVRVNKNGFPYIYGQTKAPDSTLIYNAKYCTPNSGQFITKFGPQMDTLVWSTVFGTGSGFPNISPTAFSVDLCNRVYLSGSGIQEPQVLFLQQSEFVFHQQRNWASVIGTKGMDITSNAYQSETDGLDFYFMVLTDDANYLDYATFMGEQYDGGYYIYERIGGQIIRTGEHNCMGSGYDHIDGGTSRFDRKGNIYQGFCASCWGCQGFPTAPTPGVWSSINGSDFCNNAVVKFKIHYDMVVADFDYYLNPCEEFEVRFKNISQIVGDIGVVYLWDYGDGSPESTEFEQVHQYPDTGNYTVRLIVKDTSSCNLIDTLYREITVTVIDEIEVADTAYLCPQDSIYIGIEPFQDTSFVYSWQPAEEISQPNESKTLVTPTTNQTYTLHATTNYCNKTYYYPIVINEGNISSKLQLASLDSSTVCLGDNALITLNSSGNAEIIRWSNNSSMTPIIKEGTETILNISPTQSQWYYVEIIGKYCNAYKKDSIYIPVNSTILTTNLSDTTVCLETNMIDVQVTALPNNKTYSINWDSEIATFLDSTNTSTPVLIEGSGILKAHVTDQYGCKTIAEIQVRLNDLFVNGTINDISCAGKSDGRIQINPTGLLPIEIKWDNGSNTTIRENLAEGMYSVTLTDNLGCSATEVFPLYEPSPIIENISYDDIRCENVCNGFINFATTGGVPPYTYYLNGQIADSINTELCMGEYATKITDSLGCSTTNNITIAFNERLPLLNPKANPDTILKGQTVYMIANDTIIPEYSYLWFPGIYLIDPYVNKVTSTPMESMIYNIKVEDQYRCINLDQVKIHVIDYICDTPFIFIPNAFSPNEDGINDIFKIESKVLTSINLNIYDRWGELIFTSKELEAFWDGTYKDKGVSQAVFVYTLEGTCYDGQEVLIKGNITVIK